MPVILSTSNIIIDYGGSNIVVETAKYSTYVKDTNNNTSNLLAEPFVESVSRMYPPVRTFDGTTIYPVSIAAGYGHILFITNEGKVYGCGRNDFGQLGLNDTTYRSVPTLITHNIGSLTISAISCGALHTLFLTNDGKVYGCGYNSEGGPLGLNDTTNRVVPTLITTTTVGGTPTAFNNLTISAIAGGVRHSLFLTNEGKVYSCGVNSNGELGLNDTTHRSVPTLITNTIGSLIISAIAAGGHSLFLTNNGKVYGSGYNAYGQLGLNDTTNRSIPTLISNTIGSLTISAIAAGEAHTLILTNDGKVYSCGGNDGRLGLNDTTQRNVPTLITNTIGSLIISAISCGQYRSAFLTNNGKVYSCGNNGNGELGLNDTTVRTVPTLISTNIGSLTILAISWGSSSYFLTNDGKVYSCGLNGSGELCLGHTLTGPTVPIIVPTFSKPRINGSTVNLTLSNQYIVSTAGGDAHTVFLTNDGKVYSSGVNTRGESGQSTSKSPPSIISNGIGSLTISAIACGGYHTLFLTNDGKVYSCGGNDYGHSGQSISTTIPSIISNGIGLLTISAIACGYYHSLFLTNNGKVYSCGRNDLGQLGQSTSTTTPSIISAEIGSLTISAISAGIFHTVFLTNNGKVYSCGRNANGELGLNDITNRSVPTLITTTTVGGTPTAFNNLTISAIACGGYHTVFLTNDGKVYSCGANDRSQLGLNDTTNRSVPTLISTNIGSLTISAIGAGEGHTVFLTNDGKVYSCGRNIEGQLGLNDTTNRSVPTLITNNIGSLTISAIGVIYYHTMFITNDCKVFTCGYNDNGQLGIANTGAGNNTPTIIPTFSLPAIYGSGLYSVSYSTFTDSFEPFRCFNESSSSNNAATWRAGDYNAGVFNSNLNLVSDYNGDWLVIKLPVSIKLKRFEIKQISTALNRAPKNFRLYGSTNGSSWTLLVDKENATYTSLFYVHTDLTTQYPSNTNQYYNHFGLVVNTLLGNTETTLSFDEFFIYGTEQVTPLLLNSTNKSLSIPNSILPSYPNSNLNYNLSFPVPTFVNNISTNSNIILQGDYTINKVSRTSTQLIPNGGQTITDNSSTLTLQESSNIILNYHLRNPYKEGVQWTYNSENSGVYHLGNVGIGTKTPSYPLHVSGNTFVSSTAYSGSGQTTWSTISDSRIKENIVKASYEKCLDNVKNIELYRFNFKDNTVNTNDENQLGFIAQEVRNVYPKAVEVNMIKDKRGVLPDLLSLNITQINYTLYGAVKELIKKVEILEQKLEDNENSNMMLSEEYSSNIMEYDESSSNIISLEESTCNIMEYDESSSNIIYLEESTCNIMEPDKSLGDIKSLEESTCNIIVSNESSSNIISNNSNIIEEI